MNTDEKKEKVYNFIKGNIINFVVIITSIVYIFYGMVEIKRTELTIIEVIVKGGIGIIIGLMIKEGVGENGFTKGYASNLWLINFDKYNNACNMATPYIERVDNFYICEEKEKKRKYRMATLMNYRIKYEWFFDKDGNYIENQEQFIKLNKQQKKILNKCVKIKIYTLNLFSEYGNEIEADTRKEITDKDQRLKMFGKNSLAQILTAIAGAYFTASWGGFNWGTLLSTTVQVAIWVFCGVLQLYTNYNYVAVEKVNKLKRKMELIVKFTKGCENGLYKNDPYNDENKEDKKKDENEQS